MLTLDFAQLQSWLVMFLWPFVRLTAFLAASPLWGHNSVPNQVKVGLAMLLCVAIAPGLPPLPDVPLFSWAGFGILVEQIIIGVAIGLVMRIVLATVQAAGEYIGLQMGLAFATFFSPDTGSNDVVVSRFLYMVTLLMFLAVDAHLIVIQILATSFSVLPIGALGPEIAGFDLLVRFAGTIFSSGLLLSLPLVAALLTINLSMGILNRAAPQLTIFSIGFPMTLTVGLFLIMVLMTDFGRFLQRLFETGLGFQQQLLQALAPLGS
ncbi:flagellar biosynthetic protein FliR [Pistricoccus aurantiacus]|uniref:Flagellar biosynthetic protein FliR n=1 Tax=Pistricoccus aurantiacus TaxID=1883414 RepID=A0A5B8SVU7_9GAMM|nr:flagellar biosynthetic protein FliR [Pistricoccus aurantiacus]QEA39695.1 flagellar biosynthetic protein FliR [Pistricoccus aurantiacus]